MIKQLLSLFFGCFLLGILSCDEDTPAAIVSVPPTTTLEQPKTIDSITATKPTLSISPNVGKSNNTLVPQKVASPFVKCKIETPVLPNNILELPSQNITAFITANDTTKDKEMGEGHRIFEVRSSPSCEVIFNKTLPVNVSPDFPYYLTKESCNENLGLVAIQGFKNAYIYDIGAKKLSSSLTPKFSTQREAADASSGMLSNLFFEEHFLLGYAVDFGIFAFDTKKNGTPVLPIIEKGKNADVTQLFAFEKSNGKVDLFIPILNFDEGGTLTIILKKLIDQPINIDPKLKYKLKDDRYILFKENYEVNKINHVVIDLQKKERLQIPDKIAKGHMKGVIEFLK